MAAAGGGLRLIGKGAVRVRCGTAQEIILSPSSARQRTDEGRGEGFSRPALISTANARSATKALVSIACRLKKLAINCIVLWYVLVGGVFCGVVAWRLMTLARLAVAAGCARAPGAGLDGGEAPGDAHDAHAAACIVGFADKDGFQRAAFTRQCRREYERGSQDAHGSSRGEGCVFHGGVRFRKGGGLPAHRAGLRWPGAR